ncbi:hypothetical protein E1B28_006223 [Marasmius oreades]|uniref:Alpha/beta hydrolase fold-3 domain-containing protein n=1 Tax=Marasmius oreades TaxID=181124 RepID=A0A9P7S4U3_9AGAR|nr:uncharacterized protein E1B28_006223 [Marasmius oreades]KAG7095484.1 hypothetical protein E1B28_006223 [Marasmius oreades]
MAEHAHLSKIDDEFATAFAKVPPPPPGPPTVEGTRTIYTNVLVPAAKGLVSLPAESEYQVKDHHIDVGNGVKVVARSIVPTAKEGEDGTFPLLFWCHGGGWTMGDLNWDDYRLRRAAVDTRIAVVNCEYRLAPENPFPAAVNDCFAALKHVATNPESFSGSLSKGFHVGGQSAGGNLAAVMAILARDDPVFKDRPLTGQLLLIPVTIHPDAYPEKYKSSLLSMEQNKDAPILTAELMRKYWAWYAAPPTDPRASPLLLPSHKGLPPAFLMVCGLDPLRDEGLLYGKVLSAAGVKTKVEVYSGVPHGFELVDCTIGKARKYEADLGAAIRWLLA